MKRLGIAVLGAVSLTLLLVAPAFASSPPGSTIVSGEHHGVLPEVTVRAPGATAFTGIDVTVWMVLAAALLVVGVAFLIVARRRGATAGD